MKKLSWEPEHKGDLYCSPGCGRGCTHDEHVTAKVLGKTLADELGPGWEPEIWENLGWHHCAISAGGKIKVHRYKDGSCVAFLADGKFVADGDTPDEAVRAVIAKAQEAVAGIQEILDALVTPLDSGTERD